MRLLLLLAVLRRAIGSMVGGAGGWGMTGLLLGLRATQLLLLWA